MNKKLIACAIAVFTVGTMLPSIAAATETTEASSDSTPAGPPAACVEPLDFGPARAAHSPAARPAGNGDVVDLPNCDDVEGICVEVVFPEGGSARAAHRPEEVVDTTEVPCVPIDPACDIEAKYRAPSGPARANHSQAVHPAGPGLDGYIVHIPEECQEALSLADFGSESATIMWLGAALVIIGGALVLTRRTALVRTR